MELSRQSVPSSGLMKKLTTNPGLPWFALSLVALMLFRLAYLPLAELALFYDEAYYHFWAQSLAWGYYSKPPMVAWLISLTTWLFGHQEWAVRLASPLLYAATGWLCYLLGKELYNRQTGRMAAWIIASSPLFTFNSLFITTDAPLLFCWAAALLCFARALKQHTAKYWLWLGVIAGLGLLSKYSFGLLGVGMLAYLLLNERARFAKPWPWLTALLALLLFAPNLYWNAQQHFISFQHTSDIAKLGGDLLHPGKLAEFIGGQFLLIGPITLWLFVRRIRPQQRADQLLLCSALPLLGLICLQALLSRAHVNWAAPAYVGVAVLVAHYVASHKKQRLFVSLISINLLIALLFYAYMPIQRSLGIEPTRSNTPYHRVSGWRELMQQVPAQLPNAQQQVWLSDSRKLLSYAHFYLSDWQQGTTLQVASFNPGQIITQHFDLTQDMSKPPMANSWLFVSEQPREFSGCFSQVESLGQITQPLYPSLQRTLYLYQVSGFNGYAKCQNNSINAD